MFFGIVPMFVLKDFVRDCLVAQSADMCQAKCACAPEFAHICATRAAPRIGIITIIALKDVDYCSGLLRRRRNPEQNP